MTLDEAIRQFGLPAQPIYRETIIKLLAEQTELEYEDDDEGDQELLRALCAQLFSIGRVEDSLLIWSAKAANFDTMIAVDVQFLCGAGLQATKEFLANSSDPNAADALEYLIRCEQGGDFVRFTPEMALAYARFYYHLDTNPPDFL